MPPPGRYARELGLAIRDLQQALRYAPPQQKKVINDLIRYYQTGERADWIQCGIDWVQDKTQSRFLQRLRRGLQRSARAEGRDSGLRQHRGRKDEPADDAVSPRMPVTSSSARRGTTKYKNPNPKPPIVNAVEMLVETGDFDVTTIGDNLPNEAEIHEKYGSKSFIFTGSIRALNSATGDAWFRASSRPRRRRRIAREQVRRSRRES